jgi:hypothetical protein
MRYVLARVESDPELKNGERLRYFGIEFDSAAALVPVLTKARALGLRGRLAIIEHPETCDLTPDPVIR